MKTSTMDDKQKNTGEIAFICVIYIGGKNGRKQKKDNRNERSDDRC